MMSLGGFELDWTFIARNSKAPLFFHVSISISTYVSFRKPVYELDQTIEAIDPLIRNKDANVNVNPLQINIMQFKTLELSWIEIFQLCCSLNVLSR